MSPSLFNLPYTFGVVWRVDPGGLLYQWNDVGNSFGLRPVINISSNVLISQGDGTVENPFVLKLA